MFLTFLLVTFVFKVHFNNRYIVHTLTLTYSVAITDIFPGTLEDGWSTKFTVLLHTSK